MPERNKRETRSSESSRVVMDDFDRGLRIGHSCVLIPSVQTDQDVGVVRIRDSASPPTLMGSFEAEYLSRTNLATRQMALLCHHHVVAL